MNQLALTQNILSQPNVRDVVKVEVFNAVNATVAKCFADLNTRLLDDDSLSYLVNEVTDVILKKYPSLRIAEIPTAFFKGIRHEYGEYYGLSVISFEKFIEGYLVSEDRRRLIEEQSRLQLSEKTEPTREEKFNTAKALCIDALVRVKNNGSINLIAGAVYSFLNALGLIDQSYKEGYPKEAIPAMLKEKELEVFYCMDILKRRRLNSDLEILKENIDKDIFTQEQFDECKRVSKRLILLAYLQDLILNEESLDDLIESKKELYLNNIS